MKVKFLNSKKPLSKDNLIEFEQSHKVIFYEDYKKFLLKYNGGEPIPNIFIDSSNNENELLYFYSIDEIESILIKDSNLIPYNMLPIAYIDGGSFVFYSINDLGKIFLGDSNTSIETKENDLIFVANNFTKFLSLLHVPKKTYSEQIDTLIFKNKLDTLKRLIQTGKLDKNYRNDYEESLLIQSISHNRTDILEYLLELDVDITGALSKYIYTNISNIDKKEVEFWISKGSDVNECFGSPLKITIDRKNFELFKFLLSKGANIDTKDRQGRTRLEFEIYKENPELVKLLVENGASLYKEGKHLIENLTRKDDGTFYTEEARQIYEILENAQ